MEDDKSGATPNAGNERTRFLAPEATGLDDAAGSHALEPADVAVPPAEAAVLVMVRGPEQGNRFSLNRPVTTVGRLGSNDIVVDEPEVSRHHAEFHRDNAGNVTVIDCNSLNGTYLNREELDEPTILTHGDEVRIGKARLHFLTREPDTPSR